MGGTLDDKAIWSYSWYASVIAAHGQTRLWHKNVYRKALEDLVQMPMYLIIF